MYLCSKRKKEVAALDEPEFRPINGTALTTSAISISNLLDYVNYYFPDILPESVLKHFENKFYIHNMNLQNKNETVALNAKDKISRGYNNDELSRTDNIANNASNVNNAFVVSFIVNKHTNEIQSIDVLYAVNAKKQRKQRRHSKCKSPCLNVRDECR